MEKNTVSKFLFGALPESSSPSGELNSLDWKKTGRMLVVVIVGAAATPVLDFLANLIAGINFGAYAPLVSAIVSTLLEIARRYVAQHFPPTE